MTEIRPFSASQKVVGAMARWLVLGAPMEVGGRWPPFRISVVVGGKGGGGMLIVELRCRLAGFLFVDVGFQCRA